jgi:hypothetical protein
VPLVILVTAVLLPLAVDFVIVERNPSCFRMPGGPAEHCQDALNLSILI